MRTRTLGSLVFVLLFLLLFFATMFAQAPADVLAKLPEVTRLKLENLALKEQALQKDLQAALAQINYQARIAELEKQRAALEAEVVTGLGGTPATHALDWKTGTLTPKAATK